MSSVFIPIISRLGRHAIERIGCRSAAGPEEEPPSRSRLIPSNTRSGPYEPTWDTVLVARPEYQTVIRMFASVFLDWTSPVVVFVC